MKTKYWILLLGLTVALCLAASLLFWGGDRNADRVEVWSDGQLQTTLRLSEDQTLTVESRWGTNVITVRAGAVAVTEADCPDGYCEKRGWCSGGPSVICLPNRLELRFLDGGTQDIVVG